MGTVSQEAKNAVAYYYGCTTTNNAYELCINVRKLVRSLKTAMKQAENTDNDKLLARVTFGANRAWYELMAQKNEGLATQTAQAVLDEIDFLVIDPKYSTFKLDKFAPKRGDDK